ncbi:MAG: thiamine phosphate synthase [Planctomycetes bacterium]|nr:thiamine phosphate synthase [Planctomycetota bacterium]
MRATLNSRRLCFLFTPRACRHDPWVTLEQALVAGVDLVQWRVKHRDAAGAIRARDVCREHDVPLIVNDDVELALSIDADGAHVGQDDLDVTAARAMLECRLLGVSTHDLDQLIAAERAGADYVGFGPMYPTTTKGYVEGKGADAIVPIVASATVPVFAIGGITAETVSALARAGARHFAVSAALAHAEDPAAATRAILHAIHIASPNEKKR